MIEIWLQFGFRTHYTRIRFVINGVANRDFEPDSTCDPICDFNEVSKNKNLACLPRKIDVVSVKNQQNKHKLRICTESADFDGFLTDNLSFLFPYIKYQN